MSSTFKKPYYTVVVSGQHPAKPHKESSSDLIGRVKKHPGFLGYETTRDEKGHTITVSYWGSVKSIKSWKESSDHKRQAALRKSAVGGKSSVTGGVYKSIGK
jgi:heme-degrading monooxygenase HmoA